MTQTLTPDISEKNQQIIAPIIDVLQSVNIQLLKGRLQRGLLLKEIKDKKLYIGYEGWVSSWNDFTNCIWLSIETARQDMEIYKEFNEYLENQPLLYNQIPYERLVRLLPVVKSRQQKSHTDLLDMAARSSRADFDNNLRELKGKVPNDKCINPLNCDSQKIILEKCQICGVIYRRKDLE